MRYTEILHIAAKFLGHIMGADQGGCRQYQGEFLAAEACRNVSRPGGALLHRFRHSLQYFVSCKVAVGIVVPFEVVDIDH